MQIIGGTAPPIPTALKKEKKGHFNFGTFCTAVLLLDSKQDFVDFDQP